MTAGLRVVEYSSHHRGAISVINVCRRSSLFHRYRARNRAAARVWLLKPADASLSADGRCALFIEDEERLDGLPARACGFVHRAHALAACRYARDGGAAVCAPPHRVAGDGEFAATARTGLLLPTPAEGTHAHGGGPELPPSLRNLEECARSQGLPPVPPGSGTVVNGEAPLEWQRKGPDGMIRPATSYSGDLSLTGQLGIYVDTALTTLPASRPADGTGFPASGSRWCSSPSLAARANSDVRWPEPTREPAFQRPTVCGVAPDFPGQAPPGEPGGLPEAVQPVGEVHGELLGHGAIYVPLTASHALTSIAAGASAGHCRPGAGLARWTGPGRRRPSPRRSITSRSVTATLAASSRQVNRLASCCCHGSTSQVHGLRSRPGPRAGPTRRAPAGPGAPGPAWRPRWAAPVPAPAPQLPAGHSHGRRHPLPGQAGHFLDGLQLLPEVLRQQGHARGYRNGRPNVWAGARHPPSPLRRER